MSPAGASSSIPSDAEVIWSLEAKELGLAAIPGCCLTLVDLSSPSVAFPARKMMLIGTVLRYPLMGSFARAHHLIVSC